MTFDSFGLHPDLLAGVRDLGFSTPTPIQEQAIPPGMEGRDVLASAMTGSGKTAAFLLPIMHRLMQNPGGGTRVLILSPTRELAAQIHDHFQALAKHTKLTGAAVFGGVGMKPQEQAFRRGVDVIVATPGRLLDHMQYPYTNFGKLETLVLDEADRMLDMGFLPDIKRVLKQLPKERQTLFFSATMPQPIVALSRDMLRNAATVNLARKSAPATGITQAIYPVAQELKSALFVELLRRNDVGSAIVFCRTKHRSNRLAEVLEKAGIAAARIHGNRSQTARTEALAGFKSGKYRVLVATDIVARGIDVEDLEHVVNFDVPNVPEDYIHRVGRTARADATGDAYTLVSPAEEKDLKQIERAIGKPLRRVTLPEFDYRAKPAERFEVPIGERIAEIRKRKAEDRERARQKAARQAERQGVQAGGQSSGRNDRRPRPTGEHTQRDDSAHKRPSALAGGGSSRRGGRGGGSGRQR